MDFSSPWSPFSASANIWLRTSSGERWTSMVYAIDQGSRARRSPPNGQRAPGGKKLRYVGRTCPAGVAQLPPRKTYWLTMNFPLYSPTAPGAARNPGYGVYALDVHSHTSPWSALVVTAGRGWGVPVPRKLLPLAATAATVSHSPSVGRRLPVQWA